MSFRCRKCGPVEQGIRQQKVVTKIRTVKYLFRNIYLSRQLDDALGIPKLVPSTPKTVKETIGWEIVEQATYCRKCVPKDNKPEIVDNVIRHIDRTIYKREKRERLEIKRG